MQLFSALALTLLVLARGCGGDAGGVGSVCASTVECSGSNLCFSTNTTGEAICMATCESTDRTCSGGEPCLGNEAMTSFVCYIGGDVDIGGACTSTRECNSSVCVDVSDALSCFQACTVSDNSLCSSAEECLAVEGAGDDGFCSTPPS